MKQRILHNDDMRQLIIEARLECEQPNSSSALKIKLTTGKFLQRIRSNKPLEAQLIGLGVEKRVLEYLRHDNAAGEQDDARSSVEQLDLWPVALRDLVEDINRARLFIPSRGEFVDLAPQSMTPDELDEGSDYLRTKGEEAIARADACVKLAKKWRKLL